MALYTPNRRSEFRRSFPPIQERQGTNADGTAHMVTVWEPQADSIPEVWGPGELTGEMDRIIRAASDVVHILPDNSTEETVTPSTFLFTLYDQWMMADG